MNLMNVALSPQTMLSLLVFLAAGTLAFAAMVGLRTREAVRRRAARVAADAEDEPVGKRSLRGSGLRAAQKLVDYAAKHYSSSETKDVKVLRQRLTRAGIYDPRATAVFFLARVGTAIVVAVAVFFAMPMLGFESKAMFWVYVLIGALLGYLAPSFYLDRMIAKKRLEHMAGFPDFMDLLVVCADAGLSMEASLDRVARELGDSYPSLSANIHMANLEIRAGRTMSEALEHLGDRLGLDEARSFATLISAIRRTRLLDRRCTARLFRRHASQTAVARRRKSLRATRQAHRTDDGVHLPDAVCCYSAAGHRAPGDAQLVSGALQNV